jgi:putative phosphoribosyl transferase
LDWRPNAPLFVDRLDAGRQLGEELRLRGYGDEPAVVLAIPRGGVPVGFAVTQALGVPLETIISRKLSIPSDPQIGLGAITPDGKLLLNLPQLESLSFTAEEIKQVAMETLSEIQRLTQIYGSTYPLLDLDNKTVILVDDGVASGFTMLAAVRAVRRHEPARIVVAVPVGSFSSLDRLKPQVDDLVCLAERDDTAFALADAYVDFAELTDDQVHALLQDAQSKGES